MNTLLAWHILRAVVVFITGIGLGLLFIWIYLKLTKSKMAAKGDEGKPERVMQNESV